MSCLTSGTVHPELAEVVRAAIEDINKAHNVAVAAVEAAPDRDTALAAAKALANHTQALLNRMTSFGCDSSLAIGTPNKPRPRK